MDMVKLTEKQVLGVEIIKKRKEAGEKHTCIAGYA